jgi:hypothetical protein
MSGKALQRELEASHMSEPDTQHAADPLTPRPPIVPNYGFIADVVVQYLREHPGRRDMDADDLTATALALAFPCK